jgi:hypothetical protein
MVVGMLLLRVSKCEVAASSASKQQLVDDIALVSEFRTEWR